MIKVLCIGDSLSLPGHLNKYEDTWPYLLKREFPDVDFINFFKRQLTTEVLNTLGGGERGIDKWPKGADCLEAFMPDVVIVQLGIVDCAPRLMNKVDKIILNQISNSLSNYYIKFIKFIRKRKLENTIVPFELFMKNWVSYAIRAKKCNSKVIIVSISIPDNNLISKNPQVVLNVNRYNKYLFELSQKFENVFVTKPLNPMNYNGEIYQDGYHPNKIGHEILTNQIVDFLRKFNV
jgi:acyl-CoA thioesterase-1